MWVKILEKHSLNFPFVYRFLFILHFKIIVISSKFFLIV